MKCLRSACCLLAILCSACSEQQVDLNWNTNTAHTENYRLTQEVGLDNGNPERVYERHLSLEFSGNNELNINVDTVASGQLAVTPGGHVTVDKQSVTPFDINFFLHVLPKAGAVNVAIGDSWTNLFPTDQTLQNEPSSLSLQDRYHVTIIAIREHQGNQLVELSINGDVRLVKNDWLSSAASPSAVSTTLQSTLASLRQWTPNLTGTVTFDSTNHRLHSADISFLLVPRVNVTYNDILTSEHRRRVIAAIN